MRNLLLTFTVLVMLLSQAVAPRLAVAMPVSQHVATQSVINAINASEPYSCCSDNIACQHCDMSVEHCNQMNNCLNHCSHLASVITLLPQTTKMSASSDVILHKGWSSQTTTLGVQTPPPDSL
ncbi:hypothetical protein [Shewanella fodinae]|uniref:hypothetical protein n=1 Tax=Shewanella fodinae TaxID=552357 RepID=UPI0016775EAF|nr:hypothetical protein [Shewanella fodinae]MCL2908302.1 hypothetical protein [Shewanella fodinae]